jgi:nucleoside-diphosphate-sugar epimerase
MAPAAGFSPVFVTGASGFIGACLVRRLLADGFAVHVLLRPEARLFRLEPLLDRLTVHHADLQDAPAVRAALDSARPAVVMHLAAYGAYEAQSDGARILDTNILGGYHLLHAALDTGVRVFVNAGSSSEYGYKVGAMRETDLLSPSSVYAVGKAAMTHLCTLLGRTQARMAITTFRLFSVYGPWEEATRLFPTVLRRTREGLPLEMASPDTARDYVYVEDVLDAFLSLPALSSLRGEVINIGTGKETPLSEVVEVVQEVLGRRTEVRWGAMARRRWDTNRWKASPEKAWSMLGWKPRHSLREGVARMAEWIGEPR